MKYIWIPSLMFLLFIIPATQADSTNILINEIMYHPPNDLEAEEFIELHNSGESTVDLSGWKFVKGIDYEFPDGAFIKPDGYIVICRSLDGFRAVYGKKAITFGNYERTLSNGGELITLSDSTGNVVDSVEYDDRPPWPIGADGYSASLERICPSTESDAWNWTSSPLPSDKKRSTGTPGQRNSCYCESPSPIISEVSFSPTNPKPGQSVTARAKVANGDQVTLLYRVAKSGSEGKEKKLPMKAIADGRYEAAIPGQTDHSIIRFRIKAVGGNGLVRFQPHQNELRPAYSYFVHENKESATIPIGFIINIAERSNRSRRRSRQPNLPFLHTVSRSGSMTDPPPRGTSAFVYISPDTRTYQIFDYVNVVPRKGGYKVRFHKDQPLKGMTIINLIFEYMPRFVLAEHMSYEVYKRAGVPTEYNEYVRLSVDDRLLGYHLLVEQPNRNFLRRNDRDDSGNLYKLLWYHEGVVEQHEKKTNLHTGHDDVIELVSALEKTKGKEQWEIIKQHFNVDEIMNYFAVSLCITNWDGFWNNYFAYHDINGSGKWEIYPWDEDKTWGYYDGASPGRLLYDMPLTFGMDEPRKSWRRKTRKGGPNWGQPGKPMWWRPAGYFSGPILANKYFRELFLVRLREITENIYTEAAFFPIMDELEKTLAPEMRIRAVADGRNPDVILRRFHRNIKYLKEHLTERRKFILSQKEIREARTEKKMKLPTRLSRSIEER